MSQFHTLIHYVLIFKRQHSKNVQLVEGCTCTHAINGGKQRVLLLRNAFMLTRSSSLMLMLSPRSLSFSISWRIPANRELNSCLAKIGSLWSNRKNKIINWLWPNSFSPLLLQSHLGQRLKRGDKAAVWDLDVWEVSQPVVTIESHLSFFTQPLVGFFFLLDRQHNNDGKPVWRSDGSKV